MVDDGWVRPVVHARLPLDQAADAHRLLESGEVFGKVLLSRDRPPVERYRSRPAAPGRAPSTGVSGSRGISVAWTAW